MERPRASKTRSERCERPPTLHSVAVYCVLKRFSEISEHFPGFSHIFRTFSVVSAIFRTFPEIFLSYPHTVLKLWYKNRFVSRKPPHGGNKQGRSLVQYTCRCVRASNGSTDRRIRLGRIRIADRRILEPRVRVVLGRLFNFFFHVADESFEGSVTDFGCCNSRCSSAHKCRDTTRGKDRCEGLLVH